MKRGSKFRIIVNLKLEYYVSLAKVGIHLVFLQKLQETSILILMSVDESSAKSQAKGPKSWPICISNTINKFLDILVQTP